MSKKRILVCEDEKVILKMLEMRLRAADFDVIPARDGLEALKKAELENPDLFILDVMVPGKNGFQVCHELRQNARFKNSPVIMLSAWVRDKAGEDISVADVYMRKPFDPAELLEKIRFLLGLPNG